MSRLEKAELELADLIMPTNPQSIVRRTIRTETLKGKKKRGPIVVRHYTVVYQRPISIKVGRGYIEAAGMRIPARIVISYTKKTMEKVTKGTVKAKRADFYVYPDGSIEVDLYPY